MAKAKKSKTTKRKKATGARKAAKRTRLAPRGDTRYVRRDRTGRISESDDQGRSLAQDTRRAATRTVRSGQGDRGDR